MIKKNEILEHLIDKMFEIAAINLKYIDVKDRKDEWYLKHSMSAEQNSQWIKYGKYYLMKKGFSNYFAEKEMQYLNLMLGLKIRP